MGKKLINVVTDWFKKAWRVALISLAGFFFWAVNSISRSPLSCGKLRVKSLWSRICKESAPLSPDSTLLHGLCKWSSTQRRDEVHDVSTRAWWSRAAMWHSGLRHGSGRARVRFPTNAHCTCSFSTTYICDGTWEDIIHPE